MLVVFSPCSSGLTSLLEVCEKFGAENDVLYNPIKSALMVIRAPSDRQLRIPDFSLNGQVLCAKRDVEYLGHLITDDLSDDRDIERQRCSLYAQGNMLIRKLHMCSEDVKVRLFKTFCSPMYTAYLWWNYRKCSIRKLYVAFNDGLVDSANSDIMYTSGMWRHWYQELYVHFPVT